MSVRPPGEASRAFRLWMLCLNAAVCLKNSLGVQVARFFKVSIIVPPVLAIISCFLRLLSASLNINLIGHIILIFDGIMARQLHRLLTFAVLGSLNIQAAGGQRVQDLL